MASSIPAVRERYLQKMAAGRSRTLMASGGNEPVADDGGAGNHSVFAGALLRGLQETEKPLFTAAELYREYVEETVAGRASQTPEYNPLRNSGHESGDFVFVRVKTADGKTVEVTVKSGGAGAFDPAAVELSFWETIKGSADPEDFKAYLKQYPAGRFAALANIRVANLESSAKPAATPAVSAPSESTSPATELAFWDAVKNSTSGDDFRAYMKRFPNGTFADLAANRLKVLEKDAEARRAAEPTKTFKIRWGLGHWFTDGNLLIWAKKFQIDLDQNALLYEMTKVYGKSDAQSFANGWNQTTRQMDCRAFKIARVDDFRIREIKGDSGSYRLRFQSATEAADALGEIQRICNLPALASPNK